MGADGGQEKEKYREPIGWKVRRKSEGFQFIMEERKRVCGGGGQ